MSKLASTRAYRKAEEQQDPQWESLADTSAKDAPWDQHRGTGADVAAAYLTAPEGWIERYGERVSQCSPWLGFDQVIDTSTGEISLRLERAFFCRVRTCPVCQWRRSLMWKARMYQALPKLSEAYPAARWIFLTITERNVPVDQLREQLGRMGKSWHRLVKRKEFADVLGWVKSVEITRGKDGSAHPHFHVLLLVKSTYFKPGHYVAQPKWVEAWKGAARLDYDPVIDVRAVKSRGEQGITGAVAETLKYAVKNADMVADTDWFLELTRQVRRTRAVASGGVLSEVLREETGQEELLRPDEEAEPEVEMVDGLPQLVFSWRDRARKYQRRRTGTTG